MDDLAGEKSGVHCWETPSLMKSLGGTAPVTVAVTVVVPAVGMFVDGVRVTVISPSDAPEAFQLKRSVDQV
jgi:hypothetical protein